jgi:hypothetical protein
MPATSEDESGRDNFDEGNSGVEESDDDEDGEWGGMAFAGNDNASIDG